jgi:gamma-glutamylcyclotransferase (GGCT)/AIG2-like uncharacterized protein YtfP
MSDKSHACAAPTKGGATSCHNTTRADAPRRKPYRIAAMKTSRRKMTAAERNAALAARSAEPFHAFDASQVSPRQLSAFVYAAFGSNLNKTQMAARCPAAKPLGIGMVQDFALRFRRVADLTYASGDRTHVGLYSVTADCIRSLDQYEGFPRLYLRRFIEVRTDYGNVWAFSYVMTGRDIEPPSDEYFERIYDGYMDFDLPIEPLKKARRHAERNGIVRPRAIVTHDRAPITSTHAEPSKHVSRGIKVDRSKFRKFTV